MNTKICCTCKLPKNLDKFAKNSLTPSGLNARCRSCAKTYKDAWNECNKQHVKNYYLNKKDNPEWKEKNRLYRKSRYELNKQEILGKNNLRRRSEPSKIKQRANEKFRRLTNPTYRIRTTLNSRLRSLLKGVNGIKTDSIIKLLGCSLPEFVKHLESTWRPGMTWANYGNCMECWQIDHIRPCSSFNLADPEQQKACYHFTNCQALWRLDNLKKGDSYLSD